MINDNAVLAAETSQNKKIFGKYYLIIHAKSNNLYQLFNAS